jgi:glutaredoxin
MTQQRMAKSHGRLLSISAGVILLSVLATIGCDQIDASKTLVETALSEIGTAAQLGEPANADADMESIGPDGAKRIYYQFVDDSGHVQFVERIADVPVAWREQVGFVEMSQPPPLTPQAARRSWEVSSQRTAQILATNSAVTTSAGPGRTQQEEVILYYATWCGYCKQAKSHLDSADVEYDLRNVDNDSIKSELRAKTGRTGIPVLDFSGEILRGYSSEQYDKAIRTIRG